MIPWTKMPSHWKKKGDGFIVKSKFKELKTIGSVDAQVNSIKDYLISYNTAEYDDSLNLGGDDEDESEDGEEDKDDEDDEDDEDE